MMTEREIFVFAIYGLSFFMLGFAVVVRALAFDPSPARRRLFWLAAFGLGHGAFEWLTLCRLTGFVTMPVKVDAFLLGLTFIPLLVFGFSDGGPGVARTVRPVLLLTVLWLAVLVFLNDPAVIDLSTRYLLAVPAAIGAAVVFWIDRRLYPGDSTPTAARITSIAFGVYAALQLFVQPGDFFPADILNTSTFAALFGLPVFGARAGMGLVAIAGTLALLGRFDTAMRHAIRQQLAKTHQALFTSDTSLREAQRIGKIGSWEWDILSNSVHWSDEFYRILGHAPGEIEPTYQAYLGAIPANERNFVRARLDAAAADGRPYSLEHRILLPRGGERTVHAQGRMTLDASGAPIHMRGVVQDITDRKRAEVLSMRFGRIVEDSVNEIYVFDSNSLQFLQVNRGARENLGYSDEELLLLTPVDIKPEFTRERFEETIKPLREGTREQIIFQTKHRRKDGSLYDVEVRLQLSRTETPPVFVAVIQDITDRLSIEGQLRQAQKMEAVGQLTGGVAHDFNNLLTVIIGNLELIGERLNQQPELRDLVNRAVTAADRGTTLTRSLLAFARKQTLAPEIIDLSHFVDEMTDLFRRSLGEAINVEFIRSGGLWKCEADPGQLQNALLNLVINARDAMPKGGKLTIESANVRLDDHYAVANPEVRPGQYVMLAVTDTGEGMPPTVIARAFDPFFTTKKSGKGSGLGLSMVYGFVKQSGGHVKVYSEPGHGTTVKIYLPRTTGSGAAPEPAPPPLEAVPAGATIIVVEDDPDVRDLTVNMLTTLGYDVAAAEDGARALALLPTLPRVDLVLCDVVLSGELNGREVAERIVAERPKVKVLFMSGYTENAIVHSGRLSPNVELIQKPFHKHDLAYKIRRILGRPAE